MLDIECPYCGTIYKTEIHEIDPETEFTDEQCPNCEKFYAFEYYLQPILLNVRKLEEEQVIDRIKGVKAMKNYDVDIHWGIKTVKVTFQIFEYKGYVTYRVKGNTKGSSLLAIDADYLIDTKFLDNNAQLVASDDGWYTIVLRNDKGEELRDEGEMDDLNDFIVAVEIIDMVPEDEEDIVR